MGEFIFIPHILKPLPTKVFQKKMGGMNGFQHTGVCFVHFRLSWN